MRVSLIDVDSEIPNLALMKISRYYKERGDEVDFGIEDPDRVYISTIFTRNDNLTLEEFGSAEVVKGGSGHSLKEKLSDEMEYQKPDYSLYDGMVCQKCGKLVSACKCKIPEPGDVFYSLGFTTRGCNRDCPWCVVPEKEGRFKIHQHPKEFHDNEFDKIKLLDNNILFDKVWFYKVSGWIRRNFLSVDFNQGLDIRLVDQDVADRLSELSVFPTLKFAWDKPEIEDQVRQGIEYLKKADIDLRHDVQFYVLTNFDTTHEEDLYRCRKLKEWGTNPFVMRYNGGDPFTTKLSRWANRKWLFWSCDFKNYDRLSRMERLEVEAFV